jgi:hypothetical protein
MWGALSDERTGFSFKITAGPRQRSRSRVRVPWDSRSYFAVSDSRLPFSLPPTTRRVTVKVFDLASTRDGPIENTSSAQQWIHAKHAENTASSIVVYTAPLPSNRYPIFQRICFCGYVFNDPVPSNGHGADHIENTSCNTFSISACTYFGRCLEMGLYVTILIQPYQPRVKLVLI